MANTVIRRNTDFLRIPKVGDILPAAMLFLCARAEFMGTFPFGAAMFCACFDKNVAYLGITVLYIALTTAGAGQGAIKYILAALIFWLFSKLRSNCSRIINAIVCGGGLMLSGLSMMMYGEISLYNVILTVAEAAVSGMAYIVFSNAYSLAGVHNRTAPSQEELISFGIGVSIIVTGTGGFMLPHDMAPMNIAAIFAIMLAAKNVSIGAAAAMGLCMGFITGTASSNAVVTAGIMSLCAVFANFLSCFGKFGVVVGFIGGGAVSLLCINDSTLIEMNVLEVVAASIIFILIPKRVHNWFAEFFRPTVSEEKNIRRVKTYLSDRLAKCADAFDELKGAFVSASDKRTKNNDTIVGEMFDKTAARICRGCGRCERCWENDFDKTCNVMLELLGVICDEGKLTRENIPVKFRDRCVRSGEFASELNHIYELEKSEILRMGDARISRDLSAIQYGEISRIFESFGRDINDGFDFCEDKEERVVTELDKCGITVLEANVVQSGVGKYEAVLRMIPDFDIMTVEKTVSEILDCEMGVIALGIDGCISLGSKPRYKAEVGMANKAVQEENGDSFCTFSDGDYKFYAVISDGMGNGREAKEESGMTVNLLKKFLLAGFKPETAINMINSALCLKLDKEAFATIDLLQLDLMSGTASFYKIGSAATVLYRNGEVHNVYSASPPAGIVGGIETSCQKKRLADGDVVLMVSDGVTDAPLVRTEWIKARIKADCDDMNTFAKNIIATATEKGGGEIRDDMSVIAIKISECV